MDIGFIIGVGVAIIGLLIIERILDSRRAKYQYRAKKHMMTRAEEKCFRKLQSDYGNKYYIVPQVHLSALLDHRVKGQSFRGAFAHINGKSVDFVLLDKNTLEVYCAVELDDPTHNREDRILRDKEVERIFAEAGVKLVRE